MFRMNKIISAVVLVCFLFNTAIQDLAFSQTVNFRPNVDKLAPPLMSGKDMGRVKIALEEQLLVFSHTLPSLSVDDFRDRLKRFDAKEKTIFQPADMQFFWHEPKPATADLLCYMVRLEDRYKTPRTYYAVFSLKKDAKGAFPIQILTKEQYDATDGLKNELPKLAAEDAQAIDDYVWHERGVDTVIKYAHDHELAKEPVDGRFEYKEFVQKLFKKTGINVTTPKGLTPIEDRKLFFVKLTKGIQDMIAAHPAIVRDPEGKEHKILYNAHSSNNRIHVFVPEDDFDILTNPDRPIFFGNDMGYKRAWIEVEYILNFELGVPLGFPVIKVDAGNGLWNKLNLRAIASDREQEKYRANPLEAVVVNLDHVKGREYAAGGKKAPEPEMTPGESPQTVMERLARGEHLKKPALTAKRRWTLDNNIEPFVLANGLIVARKVHDERFTVVDPKTGKSLNYLIDDGNNDVMATMPKGPVFITLGYFSEGITLWDAAKGKAVKTIKLKNSKKQNIKIECSALSKNGTKLLLGERKSSAFHLVDIKSGSIIKTFPDRSSSQGKKLINKLRGYHITNIVFMPDDKTALTTYWNESTGKTMINLWDLKTGKIRRSMRWTTWGVYSISSQWIVLTTGIGPMAVILDAETFKNIGVIKHIDFASIKFLKDNSAVVLRNCDDNTIMLVDMKTGSVIREIKAGPGELFNSIKDISPDGTKLVVTIEEELNPRVSNARAGIYDIATGERLATLSAYRVFETVAFMGNDAILASIDEKVVLWDLKEKVAGTEAGKMEINIAKFLEAAGVVAHLKYLNKNSPFEDERIKASKPIKTLKNWRKMGTDSWAAALDEGRKLIHSKTYPTAPNLARESDVITAKVSALAQIPGLGVDGRSARWAAGILNHVKRGTQKWNKALDAARGLIYIYSDIESETVALRKKSAPAAATTAKGRTKRGKSPADALVVIALSNNSWGPEGFELNDYKPWYENIQVRYNLDALPTNWKTNVRDIDLKGLEQAGLIIIDKTEATHRFIMTESGRRACTELRELQANNAEPETIRTTAREIVASLLPKSAAAMMEAAPAPAAAAKSQMGLVAEGLSEEALLRVIEERASLRTPGPKISPDVAPAAAANATDHWKDVTNKLIDKLMQKYPNERELVDRIAKYMVGLIVNNVKSVTDKAKREEARVFFNGVIFKRLHTGGPNDLYMSPDAALKLIIYMEERILGEKTHEEAELAAEQVLAAQEPAPAAAPVTENVRLEDRPGFRVEDVMKIVSLVSADKTIKSFPTVENIIDYAKRNGIFKSLGSSFLDRAVLCWQLNRFVMAGYLKTNPPVGIMVGIGETRTYRMTQACLDVVEGRATLNRDAIGKVALSCIYIEGEEEDFCSYLESMGIVEGYHLEDVMFKVASLFREGNLGTTGSFKVSDVRTFMTSREEYIEYVVLWCKLERLVRAGYIRRHGDIEGEYTVTDKGAELFRSADDEQRFAAMQLGEGLVALFKEFNSALDAERAPAPAATAAAITSEPWGTFRDKPVSLYTLTNSSGASVKISSLGGTIVSINVPDRNGNMADVVLGHDSLKPYTDRNTNPYFGSIIGRYGNRIAEGKFTLDGVTYTLAKNNGPNHLHGGNEGFDLRIWGVEEFKTEEGAGLKLRYTSPDGEEGYPGNLEVTVTYLWTHNNELKITYYATTDKATPVNLTNHFYTNLSGQGNGTILGHQLMVNSEMITPVADSNAITTGELMTVAGTPFDFRKPTVIGDNIKMGSNDKQLGYGSGGIDHNFVLDRGVKQNGLVFAAKLIEPVSGRTLAVETTEPSTQVYTGNFLNGTIKGKGGAVYKQHAGLCLETQHPPDSPNKEGLEGFPTTILRPGNPYTSTTVYKFGVDNKPTAAVQAPAAAPAPAPSASTTQQEITMPTVDIATEACMRIPIRINNAQYKLLVTEDLFANGDFNKAKDDYNDRFDLEQITNVIFETPESTEKFVGELVAKDQVERQKTVMLVPAGKLTDDQLQRLADKDIRFVLMSPTELSNAKREKSELERKLFQRDAFNVMRLVRKAEQADLENAASPIRLMLEYYFRVYFNLGDASPVDCMRAIITGKIAQFIKVSLNYRPSVPRNPRSEHDQLSHPLMFA